MVCNSPPQNQLGPPPPPEQLPLRVYIKRAIFCYLREKEKFCIAERTDVAKVASYFEGIIYHRSATVADYLDLHKLKFRVEALCQTAQVAFGRKFGLAAQQPVENSKLAAIAGINRAMDGDMHLCASSLEPSLCTMVLSPEAAISTVEMATHDPEPKCLDQGGNSPVASDFEMNLTLYMHALSCRDPVGQCGVLSCWNLKETVNHIFHCQNKYCEEQCSKAQKLCNHFRTCCLDPCVLCDPFRKICLDRKSVADKILYGAQMCPKAPPSKRAKMAHQFDSVQQAPKDEDEKTNVGELHNEPAGTGLCGMASLGVPCVELPNFEVEEVPCIDPTLRAESCSADLKTTCVSLLSTFTSEKLTEHIKSLQLHANQEKMAVPSKLENENTCSLCREGKLHFVPPLRYCALCSKLIDPKRIYYTNEKGSGIVVSICSNCHIASGKVKFPFGDIPRENFTKNSNYAETDAESEPWVQCDKCEKWQHQVCALFNEKRNETCGEYACANCLLMEIQSGARTPADACNSIPDAKDLPRTRLSDHVERWLFDCLKQDWSQRVASLGTIPDEVPRVEGLTVRVVSSIEKAVEVQPCFRKLFKEIDYPENFPFKSKVILLFQKIDGVDICLFAMYVQEYGSKCPHPNQRHVYLAYIDSVKYFRPDIKAASGEALRTFVYHEILLGYLDYCKKRGFVSCSIWACPSNKHDDYVLYCHPASQKMPKADKLRGWYRAMINKAKQLGIIHLCSNLYDLFLQAPKGSMMSISTRNLPYCENDFWPGEAGRILEKDTSPSQKKEDETTTGRLLRVAKREEWKGNPADMLLLHKLGEKIRKTKEDFIVVYLQKTCKHCCSPILSGKSWVCMTCRDCHLCNQCYSDDKRCCQRDQPPLFSKKKHAFKEVEETGLPETTEDEDPVLESKFLDCRTDFLKHCQDSHYQFDTMRRAKYSTMMILHHLHASIGTLQTAAKAPDHLQQHKLKKFFKVLLHSVLHVSRCSARQCKYPYCIKVKNMYRHGLSCQNRMEKGCQCCRKMWFMLDLHSKQCENSVDCQVPKCRELKERNANKRKRR